MTDTQRSQSRFSPKQVEFYLWKTFVAGAPSPSSCDKQTGFLLGQRKGNEGGGTGCSCFHYMPWSRNRMLLTLPIPLSTESVGLAITFIRVSCCAAVCIRVALMWNCVTTKDSVPHTMLRCQAALSVLSYYTLSEVPSMLLPRHFCEIRTLCTFRHSPASISRHYHNFDCHFLLLIIGKTFYVTLSLCQHSAGCYVIMICIVIRCRGSVVFLTILTFLSSHVSHFLWSLRIQSLEVLANCIS